MKNISYKSFFFYLFLVLIIIIRLIIFSESFKRINSQSIRITGRVSQEPSKFSKTQKIYLEGFNLYLPKYPQINYGDEITVEGIVDKRKLINAVLIKSKKNENPLLNFRKKIISFYQTSLPQPHSTLIAGIILGYKSEKENSFWESLQNTGTMHVVVASGMNITFVAGFLMSLLINFMPRRKVLITTLIGIWIYAFISGFEAPIVRSSIMFSIVLVAQLFGKNSTSLNALILSALIMLIFKPMWLYDLGFMLSFSATASLMLFTKKVERLINFVPKYIKGDLSTTLAAQIGVAPILLVTFGEFNLISPFINVIVLWTIPLIMIIGTVAGLIGVIIPDLGRLILYLVYPLTWYFVSVVGIF